MLSENELTRIRNNASPGDCCLDCGHEDDETIGLLNHIDALKEENARLREALSWLFDQDDFPIGYEWKLREALGETK